MKKPHSMWHGDVMIAIRLPDGTFIYQCTIEDDYSRGYSGVLSKHKDARIVLYALIDAILRWESVPTCFHYDNGGEAKCSIVKAFLKNLSDVCNHEIRFIPTKVRNPRGNGKKERAHRDDRRDFWKKTKSKNIQYLRKKFKNYLQWRNNKKGHFALKGKPSITRLKENKKPKRSFSREFLESLAKVKVAERIVRSGGVIFLYGKFVYTDKNLIGKKVDLVETLNGLEVSYGGVIFNIIEDYWENIKKVS
jgi:transposase InsO family protein